MLKTQDCRERLLAPLNLYPIHPGLTSETDRQVVFATKAPKVTSSHTH